MDSAKPARLLAVKRDETRLPRFARGARKCGVGQTDASAVDIDPGNGRTLAGFDDNSDWGGGLVLCQKSQRLRKLAACILSRAKHFSRGDFRAWRGHFENRVRVSRRQNNAPGPNSPTDGKHPSGLVQHDQI
jgi:hypothetical protein